MIGKVRKVFFFEKKKQKTFRSGARALKPARTQTIKVFFASFLFTKKKILSCLFLSRPSATHDSAESVAAPSGLAPAGRFPVMNEE